MIINNVNIVLEDRVIENGSIKVEDGIITNINEKSLPNGTVNGNGMFLYPGFIDPHFHGGYGVDIMSDSKRDIIEMLKKLPSEGITTCLLTTSSKERMQLKKILKILGEVIKDYHMLNSPVVEGIHLEGPFINFQKRGNQYERSILKPTAANFDEFNNSSLNNIKVVTYAIDECDTSFTEYLVNNNIIPQVGHSNATMWELFEHTAVGLKGITHFQKDHSHHDELKPGITTGVIKRNDLFLEIIPEDTFVNPDVIKLFYKISGPDKLMVITNSIRVKGLDNGTHLFQGHAIIVNDSVAKGRKKEILGSALTMNKAVSNMKKVTNCSHVELAKMASTNASKNLNIYEKTGSIEVGKNADLVLVDENINVHMTMVKGNIVYKKF